VTHAINFVLNIIFTLIEFVLGAIGIADAFLAGLMTSAGLPANLQTAVLFVVGLLLFIFAVRVLGRVFAFLILILLILLLLHRVYPGMQIPHSMLPANWQQSGGVHI
jgi:hypothetical protein